MRFLLVSYAFPPAVSVQTHRVVKLVKVASNKELKPYVLSVRRGDFTARDDASYEEIRHLLGDCRRTFSLEPNSLLWAKQYLKGNLAPALDEKSAESKVIRQNSFIKRGRIWNAIRPSRFYRFISPDKYRGWQIFAVSEGLKLIKEHSIDCIYTNSYPYTTHFIGERLHDITGLPWFMDFRDGWVEDDDIFLQKPKWQRVYESKACDRMLSKSAAAFFITPGIRDRYARRLPELATKFHTVIQGYDESVSMPPPKQRSSLKMILTYTGSFFLPSYSPEPLLKAFLMLKKSDPEIAKDFILRFVGNVVMAENMAADMGLTEQVETIPLLPYKEALQEMVDADVLVTILLDTEWNKVRLGTKTFDYIRSDRPIMALVPPDSAVAEVFAGAGVADVVHPENTKDIVSLLKTYWLMWKNGKLNVSGNAAEIDKLRSTNTLGLMVDIIKQNTMKQKVD